ncbi:hypothetical protein DVH24_004847 [Malus domestica]|uniref:Uncharacterized protein n=1 Tax=Malus domestica TaxID=3750 RepID=A0A498II85_MALDO|nr:hypothetical protein DVH24_004847 [Malus domestica]
MYVLRMTINRTLIQDSSTVAPKKEKKTKQKKINYKFAISDSEKPEKKPKKKATKKKATEKMTRGEKKIKCLQIQGHTSCWTKKQRKKKSRSITDNINCIDYFWLIPKTGSMAIELVLSSDSTSLCVDGAIDAKLVDAAFYIMSENETNEGREPNLYISSYIFNNTEMERPKSDVEYLDQRLKRILGENMDKVGKVFIPMKHYFHVTLIVWVIQK